MWLFDILGMRLNNHLSLWCVQEQNLHIKPHVKQLQGPLNFIRTVPVPCNTFKQKYARIISKMYVELFLHDLRKQSVYSLLLKR